MKQIFLVVFIHLIFSSSLGQDLTTSQNDQAEINKEIARQFYQDLWFTNNTDNYKKYVADHYVVHDIGDRKGIMEPAIEQKNIADFFWKHGDFDSKINYQIAEGDLVATHWEATFKPKTLFGSMFIETKKPISIINVFRIENGKIVELWNHRHDIDTPQTLKFTFKGFLIGLVIALVPTLIALRLRRKLKRLTA